jgi:hypothetical protein
MKHIQRGLIQWNQLIFVPFSYGNIHSLRTLHHFSDATLELYHYNFFQTNV